MEESIRSFARSWAKSEAAPKSIPFSRGNADLSSAMQSHAQSGSASIRHPSQHSRHSRTLVTSSVLSQRDNAPLPISDITFRSLSRSLSSFLGYLVSRSVGPKESQPQPALWSADKSGTSTRHIISYSSASTHHSPSLQSLSLCLHSPA